MNTTPQINSVEQRPTDSRLIRVAVITVSDRAFQGTYKDESGPKVVGSFPLGTFDVVVTRIVPDEAGAISKEIVRCVDHDKVDFVVTIGGAGSSNRDVTPEATSAVIHREVPGLSDAIRLTNREAIPGMLLSRGISGIRNHTLIVNLPGHPDSAKLAIETILPAIPHCVKSMKQHRPANSNPQNKSGSGLPFNSRTSVNTKNGNYRNQKADYTKQSRNTQPKAQLKTGVKGESQAEPNGNVW